MWTVDICFHKPETIRNKHIYFSVLYLPYPDINVSFQWTNAGKNHHWNAEETT